MKKSLGFRIILHFLVPLLLVTQAVAVREQARLVAIGDVHGAYTEFLAILQRMGLTDENRQWTGGSAILVQTGDILDRGPGVRDSLDLLMRLEGQAEKQHGRVIALLGNHEAMNLMGDLRYVTVEEYRSFAGLQSDEVRENAYRDFLNFLKSHRRHSHSIASEDQVSRQKWMEGHPPGFFEYRDAMGPRGAYGRWLSKHHAVLQIGEIVFVHGGLNPKLPIGSIAGLDEQIRSDLTGFDSVWQFLCDRKVIWRYMRLNEAMRQVAEELNSIKARQIVADPEVVQQMQKLLELQSCLAASPDGPLWYRGLALDPEESLAADLKAMLARLKFKYLVAGHTVEAKGDIVVRFDNHIFLIDTGMLKQAYGGRASALEVQNGKFSSYYVVGEPRVLVMPPPEDSVPPAAPRLQDRLERQ